MRYISFTYSSLDRFRQAILVSYMVNVGLDSPIRYSEALGGGALLDAGTYTLHA